MIQIELVKYGQRIAHNSLPEGVKKIAYCNAGLKLHHYPTRNKNMPNIEWHTCHQFNISFLCKGLSIYSSLPQHLKEIMSM